jgi:spore germination protein KC
MKKNALLIIILLGVITNITGCWDQIELDKRSIVMAIGIDKAEEPGKIMLTLQSIIPGRLTTPMQGGNHSRAVRVISISGMTILEAIKNYQQQTDAIPYFKHNRLLVISEELARDGVNPIMDYFIRNLQNQPRAWVLIAKGKAADIVQWQTEVEQIPADYIADLLYCSTRQAITALATDNVHRFILALSSQSTSPATSGIEVVKEKADQPPEVRVFGTAVFKKDKLVGWLGLRETRGLLWITNQSSQGILEIGYPDRQKKNLVQQITRSSSKIKPKIRNGRVEINVVVSEEGNIGEQDGSLLLTNQGMIPSLEKRKSAEIRAEVESCLKKCQNEFHSDIFGFGEEVERRFPQEWKRLKKRWDTEFPMIKVAVSVKAKIRSTGIITDPINLR